MWGCGSGSTVLFGNIFGQQKVLSDRMVYGVMGEEANGISKPLLKW